MQTPDRNLFAHSGAITAIDRAAVLGQKPLTIWLTGLSASGKSTLAYALEAALLASGKACYVLDGDNVRQGLNKDLGFSDADRAENIRRVAEVARLMNEAGLIVITAFISPFEVDRTLAKAVIGDARFVEVYLSTPIEVCEARDPKGLYQKARAGRLAEFTGVSQVYEVPDAPDISIDSSHFSVHDAVGELMGFLEQRSFGAR